jgi:hypothetical protein
MMMLALHITLPTFSTDGPPLSPMQRHGRPASGRRSPTRTKRLLTRSVYALNSSLISSRIYFNNSLTHNFVLGSMALAPVTGCSACVLQDGLAQDQSL